MARNPRRVSLSSLAYFRGVEDDDDRMVLMIARKVITESTPVVRLLSELHAHTGRVLKRDYLTEALGITGEHKGQTLNEYVRRLRKVLRANRVHAEVAVVEEIGYALCEFAQ